MAEPARKLMTVEEFLAWDDGTMTKYDLIEGVPVARGPVYNRAGEIVAMSPPTAEHGVLAARLAAVLSAALASRPNCRVHSEAGIRRQSQSRSYFHADLAVSCAPLVRGGLDTPDPILIVEVLSPSTEDHDRKVKLSLYRLLPSVREILLIDPARYFCEVHRRVGDLWATDLLVAPGEVLKLESVGLAVALEELYAGLPLKEEFAASVASGAPDA